MSTAAPAWRPTFGPSPSAAPVGTAKVVLAAVAVLMLVALVAGVGTVAALSFTLVPVPVVAPAPEAPDPALEPLREEVGKLEASLAAKVPRRAYIVIDRYNNRLWLRRGSEIRLEAVVSAGSGTILKESGGKERVWTFDTPPGKFQVLSERRNPVWTKPDWAFLEEGQDPPENFAERREKGSLGEWALDLGDGYMIHGTLYERLLGRNITHGCVRVGRDDLRVVAEAAVPGTPVFIF
ncbi:MAG TPA: L,D-transpeptidase [Longimicrobiales bacterium]|nr:L,D-transpeptidase [Longimicrobiales bacterium]